MSTVLDRATIELSARIMQMAVLSGKRPYIQDIVDLMGVKISYGHYKHEFSREIGCGPAEYMRIWRSLVFIKVLRETRLTIPEMGFDYGFVDAGQTARIVKRETGHTCNQIRRMTGPEVEALKARIRGSLFFPLEMPDVLPETKPQFRRGNEWMNK